MYIYDIEGQVLADVIITKDAEHEEELMKSDFVKLAWNSDTYQVLPTDAYIVPFGDGVHYSLLEPYTPEQKSETEWRYEPKFQHPKMYLGKVPFDYYSKDENGNDVTLLVWPYSGPLAELLQKFCDTINKTFHYTNDNNKITYQIIGDIGLTASVNFDNYDILSALSRLAQTMECEYHIDWEQRLLFFGHIMIDREELTTPVLHVSQNVGNPSARDSKEGFWNAYLPQGSTRNITRRAQSGEAVQAKIRLALDKDTEYTFTDLDGSEKQMKTPDGIVYTDDNGHIITKDAFSDSKKRKHIKSVLFEEVYPKFDLYLYDVRCRELYKKDKDTGELTEDKYAQWFFKLAYPIMVNGHVQSWEQYKLTERISFVLGKDNYAGTFLNPQLTLNGYRYVYTIQKYVVWPDNSYVAWDINDFHNKAHWSKEEVKSGDVVISKKYRYDYPVLVKTGTFEAYCNIELQQSNANLNPTMDIFDTIVLLMGDCYQNIEDALDDPTGIAFTSAADEAKSIDFSDPDLFPENKPRIHFSQIVDGKEPYIAFNANTYKRQTGETAEHIPIYFYAQTSPLAGRGNGDGEGHYGFGLKYIATQSDVEKATESTSDSASDIPNVEIGDFALAPEDDGDYVLPSTQELGIIPKGMVLEDGTVVTDLATLNDSQDQNVKDDGQTGNDANIYNITASKDYEVRAQHDLATAISDYIKEQFTDNNSYTVPSNPVVFEQELKNNNPDYNLYIGRRVFFKDISGRQIEARIQKVITKIDYPFEKQITVGNEILKSSQQQLKDDVKTITMGLADGNGGLNYSQVRTLIQNYVTPRFLSKLEDDVAQGEIGFIKGLWVKAKGLFGIDADGKGVFSRIATKVMESMNFSGGDSLFGTGWQITDDDGTGLSKMIVDNLAVRGKFTANVLEARKLVSMGGNYVFSPASSVIEEVDYYDSSNNLLGYERVNVPFILKYVPLSLLGKYLSRKSLIRSTMSANDWSSVHHYRCWLKADDGTTSTINTWREGMLARCQTFDVNQAPEATHSGTYGNAGQTWTGKNVTNKLYWRAVVGTGSVTKDTYNGNTDVLKDGKTHHYIDLANYYIGPSGNRHTLYLDGSDHVTAGDHIVCYGDYLHTDTSNIISIETIGDEAPCIRELMNVGYDDGTFPKWTLDGCERTRISPVAGNRFVAPEFIVSTSPNGMTGEKLYNENDKGAAIDFIDPQELPSTGTVGDILLVTYSSYSPTANLILVCTESSTPEMFADYEGRPVKLGDSYILQEDGHRYVATMTGWEDKGLVNESLSELRVDINGIYLHAGNAGIDLENDEINLKAGQVNFYKSDGTVAPISINANTGRLTAQYATFNDAVITGTISSGQGVQNAFSIDSATGEVALGNGVFKIHSDGSLCMYAKNNGANPNPVFRIYDDRSGYLGCYTVNGQVKHGMEWNDTGVITDFNCQGTYANIADIVCQHLTPDNIYFYMQHPTTHAWKHFKVVPIEQNGLYHLIVDLNNPID